MLDNLCFKVVPLSFKSGIPTTFDTSDILNLYDPYEKECLQLRSPNRPPELLKTHSQVFSHLVSWLETPAPPDALQTLTI